MWLSNLPKNEAAVKITKMKPVLSSLYFSPAYFHFQEVKRDLMSPSISNAIPAEMLALSTRESTYSTNFQRKVDKFRTHLLLSNPRSLLLQQPCLNKQGISMMSLFQCSFLLKKAIAAQKLQACWKSKEIKKNKSIK